MCIRGNHLPFMNKELSKEVIHRTRLQNYDFLRNGSDENKRKFSSNETNASHCSEKIRKIIAVI